MVGLSISVIIPTYNRADLVLRAVDSALQQCIAGDEIIVVDDGSTDNTREILGSRINDVRYFRVENSGVSAARNYGIEKAVNPLIAFLDDDDEWLPYKLTLQRRLMEEIPDVLFSFTNFENQYKDGRREAHGIFNWGQVEKTWEKIIGPSQRYSTIAELPDQVEDFKIYIGDIYISQLSDDYILPSTMMVKKEAGAELHFPEDLSFCESWACSSRLARAGKVAYLDCDMTRQHGHSGPRLTDVTELFQARSRIKVLERQWGRDEAFLSQERGKYERRLDRERLLVIKRLIGCGENSDARIEINKLFAKAPLLYRIAASFPSIITQTLIFAVRIARRVK